MLICVYLFRYVFCGSRRAELRGAVPFDVYGIMVCALVFTRWYAVQNVTGQR